MKTDKGFKYSLRLSDKDEEQRKIINILESLKSTMSYNQFVTDALKYYVDCMEKGILSSDTLPNVSRFVTRDEVQEIYDGQKEEIRRELYEDIIRIISVNAMASHVAAVPMSAQPVNNNVQTGGHGEDTESMNEVLDDVMKWS